MKHLLTTFLLAMTIVSSIAQTLNVQQGNITYAFTADGNDMRYSDNGQTLTIGQKAFNVSGITQITIDETSVEANTVSISYDGTSANVTIAGNVAPYVNATVNGAHVSISQTNTADIDGEEITYELSGTITIDDDDMLHFKCRNSKANAPSQEKGGVGLANVRKRLNLLYGHSYSLRIQDSPDNYNVELNIPLS